MIKYLQRLGAGDPQSGAALAIDDEHTEPHEQVYVLNGCRSLRLVAVHPAAWMAQRVRGWADKYQDPRSVRSDPDSVHGSMNAVFIACISALRAPAGLAGSQPS